MILHPSYLHPSLLRGRLHEQNAIKRSVAAWQNILGNIQTRDTYTDPANVKWWTGVLLVATSWRRTLSTRDLYRGWSIWFPSSLPSPSLLGNQYGHNYRESEISCLRRYVPSQIKENDNETCLVNVRAADQVRGWLRVASFLACDSGNIFESYD